MGYENSAGLNVSNHYGPREFGPTNGNVKTVGRSYEVSVEVDPLVLANGGPLLVTDVVIPAKAVIEDVYADVSALFALGGTTPTILVGTDTSEVTNGVVISEAQAEAVGTYDITGTLTGTWAAPLAADTTVGIVLGGTTPTVTAVGKVIVTIRYTKAGV